MWYSNRGLFLSIPFPALPLLTCLQLCRIYVYHLRVFEKHISTFQHYLRICHIKGDMIWHLRAPLWARFCHQVTPLLPPLGLSFLLCKEMGLDYIKLSLISIIINGGTFKYLDSQASPHPPIDGRGPGNLNF